MGGEAQAVVDGALVGVEDAAQDQVGARRELGGDLGLAAAQQEGADLGLELAGDEGVAELDAAGVAGGELLAPAEQAGVAEVREAPQLEQAIFDGGAAEGDPPAGLQGEGGGGGGGGGVLDRLGLVEDEDIPRFFGEDLLVEAQEGVAGEGDAVAGGEGARGAVIEVNAQAGAKSGQLGGPIVQGAGRGDDEAAAAKCTQCLQGLAEAHVVGQQRADAGVAQEAQPVDALALIITQGGLQVGGEGGRGNVGITVEQGGEAGELGAGRGVEGAREGGGGGAGPARELAGELAGGEVLLEHGAMFLEPGLGQPREATADAVDGHGAGAPGLDDGLGGDGELLAGAALGLEVDGEAALVGGPHGGEVEALGEDDLVLALVDDRRELVELDGVADRVDRGGGAGGGGEGRGERGGGDRGRGGGSLAIGGGAGARRGVEELLAGGVEGAGGGDDMNAGRRCGAFAAPGGPGPDDAGDGLGVDLQGPALGAAADQAHCAVVGEGDAAVPEVGRGGRTDLVEHSFEHGPWARTTGRVQASPGADARANHHRRGGPRPGGALSRRPERRSSPRAAP